MSENFKQENPNNNKIHEDHKNNENSENHENHENHENSESDSIFKNLPLKLNYFIDRKRSVFLEGATGASKRVKISGQVVDLYIPENNFNKLNDDVKKNISDIDLFKLKLFYNIIEPIEEHKPLEDFYLPSVGKAKLIIEILDVTPENFNLKNDYKIIYKNDEVICNSKGFFYHKVEAPIEVGKYTFRITLATIESIRQNLKDFKFIFKNLIKNKESNINKPQENEQHENSGINESEQSKILGYGKIEILNEDSFLIISDLDHTFLNTQLEDRKGLLGTLVQKANEKKIITGMKHALLELQNNFLKKSNVNSTNTEKNEQTKIPLFFLSASPHFFRRSLMTLFYLNGIEVSGLYLKYYSKFVDSIISKISKIALNPLQNLNTFNFRKVFEELTNYLSVQVQSIFDNIGYKLEMLLQNRLMQNTNSKEILLGDNYDRDHVTFVLYQILLLNIVEKDLLKDFLNKIKYLGKEILSRETIENLYNLTISNIEIHGAINPVNAVWINDAKKNNHKEKLEDLLLGVLQPMFAFIKINLKLTISDLEKYGVNMPKIYEQGPGLILCAYDEGLVNELSVKEVFSKSLIEDKSTTKEDLSQTLIEFNFKDKKNFNELNSILSEYIN